VELWRLARCDLAVSGCLNFKLWRRVGTDREGLVQSASHYR
jgi:hypothetical protein